MNKNTSVTQDTVDNLIKDSTIITDTLFDKVVLVSIQLPSGFVLTETSGSVDPKNFDYDLGYNICIEHLKNRLWELEGYKLQSKLSKEGN